MTRASARLRSADRRAPASIRLRLPVRYNTVIPTASDADDAPPVAAPLRCPSVDAALDAAHALLYQYDLRSDATTR